MIASGAAAARALGQKRAVLVYIGSYSNPQGPEGSKGNGKGIHLLEMDTVSGRLTQRDIFESDANPSWLAFNKAGTVLYSANELPTGSVTAWRVETGTGKLTALNTVSSEGEGPCHLSAHPSGKWVFAANYHGGTTSVLPVKEDGRLGEATDVYRHGGTVGPIHAKGAPPGSFAISGHDKPHAHMVEADPSGRFVLVADLGLDQIRIFRLDAERGKLVAADPPFLPIPGGDGPRHFLFHPNGRWFYSLQEEGSTLMLCDWDTASGRLTPRQTLSTLPKGFAGTNFTSEVRISPDAKYLYAANRLHDSIAWFSIAADGRLTLSGETWTRGDYPRSFTIDPTGEFLYSCNQRADAVGCFRVNRGSGELTFTGQYTPIGTPAIVLFGLNG
jgi:6-phosphogluconolactonase (cycloisomerase 2 family)